MGLDTNSSAIYGMGKRWYKALPQIGRPLINFRQILFFGVAKEVHILTFIFCFPTSSDISYFDPLLTIRAYNRGIEMRTVGENL